MYRINYRLFNSMLTGINILHTITIIKCKGSIFDSVVHQFSTIAGSLRGWDGSDQNEETLIQSSPVGVCDVL